MSQNAQEPYLSHVRAYLAASMITQAAWSDWYHAPRGSKPAVAEERRRRDVYLAAYRRQREAERVLRALPTICQHAWDVWGIHSEWCPKCGERRYTGTWKAEEGA